MPDEIYAEVVDETAPTDIAWAAEPFEGEGCFTISTDYRNGYRQARAKLNSTDRDVVYRFAGIVGVGQVRKDNAQVRRGWKQQWEWYASSSKADVREVIRLFWPFFGNRRSLRAIDLLGLLDGGQG